MLLHGFLCAGLWVAQVACRGAYQPSDALRRRAALSQADICQRWSQQSAIINGTLYFYGGRRSVHPAQQVNTWVDDFLSLDLTRTWSTVPNPLRGLPQPVGPPAVSNGYLWASYESIYLYGGEYSDSPFTQPSAPFTLWEYNVRSSQWIERPDPVTSEGESAPDDGVPVLDAAEGAGFSVAKLGRGWYFGGHEDTHTVYQWDNSIPRKYLKSLLEYTFPGYENPDVYSLSNGGTADADGVWRNITTAAKANEASFPERADGVLVYIPGFSNVGVLLGLAGGTRKLYNQLNIIDVYDIESSTWYQQATTGTAPEFRVNPCAIVAAAADGSSYNVYMFGGQSLGPPTSQVPYNDMWILTVPSFQWIEVNQDGQSVPLPRSGHTCNVWDSQLVLVGGYVPDVSCDAPGVYIFDASTLQWQNKFVSASKTTINTQSEQVSQIGSRMALQGSFGYTVPDLVLEHIGGGPYGGATATSPSIKATGGPFVHGKAPHYSVPGHPNPGSEPPLDNGSGGGGSSTSSSSGISQGAKIGAIVAGVIAGILLLIVIYLAFVAWLYRKRLREYKATVDSFGRHPGPEMSQTNPRGRSRGVRYNPMNRSTERAPSRDSFDILGGKEPTFVGIMLHPRRSLRVVNPD